VPLRLAIAGLLLAFSIVTCGIAAADPAVADIVARIAGVERRLPWVWSPAAEGLADIAYTYEVRMTRRVLTRGGQEIPPTAGGGLSQWRALQLERIPLDWGSFMRCVSENGTSPCSNEWVQEFERQTRLRDKLTPEDRARIDATREERRQRRRAFWDDFASALRIENSGANQLRFSPLPGYKARPGTSNGMLTAISGQLWFDPSTHEITRLEYDLLRDADEPFLRLPKGSHFGIELTKLAGKHYLPLRISVRQKRGKAGEIEEKTTGFSQFRLFESESKIQFIDPKDAGKQ
jgi:hypothetical protein